MSLFVHFNHSVLMDASVVVCYICQMYFIVICSLDVNKLGMSEVGWCC